MFIEDRFPDDISYGSAFKPNYSTRIITSAAGYEARNSNWSESRFTADISYGIKTLAQLQTVQDWFHAVKGRAIGFRFKDWSDFATGSPVGFEDVVLIASAAGGETQVQLKKTYLVGSQETARTIRKPVAGTVRLGKNGAELTEGPDFTVDTTTGIVTLGTPLAATDLVTGGCEFDVPVRFANDTLPISLDFFEGGNTNIDVIEVRKD